MQTTIDIEALHKAVTDAQAAVGVAGKALADAKLANAEAIAALSGTPDPWEAFKALAEKLTPFEDAVASAGRTLDRANAAVKHAEADSAWAASAKEREPLMKALRTMLVEQPVQVQATSAIASAVKGEDGSVKVTLTISVDKPDVSDIESALAKLVAPLVERVGPVTMRVTGIADVDESGTSKALINIVPTASLNAAGRSGTGKTRATSTGGRSGNLEYIYNGQVLGARAFLVLIEASGHSIATDRKVGFETVLRGTGNGLSNLAKQVADKLNISSRQKVATS